jgi:molybdenum cofactor cytidylyltransferase
LTNPLNQSTNQPHTQPQITAIFLAAGTSSRYGNGINKLLLPFDGELVVQRSLRNLIEAGVQRIIVVTGHDRERIEAAVKDMTGLNAISLDPSLSNLPGLAFTHNPDYREGEMISSIKAGLRAISPLVHGDGSRVRPAALITLADQPLLPPSIIRRVIQAFDQNCGHIIAPRFNGQRGHPVLLHSRFFEEALTLPSSAFLRELLKRHPEAVTHLQVNTDVVLRDVDTPETYAEAISLLSHHRSLSCE